MKANEEFIVKVAPVAISLRIDGSPIFPSVRIAQALLETGGVLHHWNNLVGFKVGSGVPNEFWKGASVSAKTWEVINSVRLDNVTADFRAYGCIEDCFRDQDVLFSWVRYDRVRNAKTPDEQTQALYSCGYATDPNYAIKLNALIESHNLKKYDEEAEAAALKLDPGVAVTIIQTWISPAWIAEQNKAQRDYLHWLANELRRAADLPLE